LRIISLIFGALTVFFIFKTALLLFPGNRNLALLAASLCAFNPQFNFLSGSLNNDNLVILCATISIWLLARLIVTENGNQKKVVALLGIFLALGLITKLNISGLVIVAILGIIYSSVVNKPKKLHNLSINLLLFLGLLIIIAGWYFVRNASIFGLNDPLGWGLQAIQNPGLVMHTKFRTMFFKKIFFQRLYTSFWGAFDWLTIPLTNWMYWIYGIISIMGILGFTNIFMGKSYPKSTKICLLLFLFAIFISFASLVTLNLKFVSAQARLIFPVMAGICIFMALGIDMAVKYLSRLVKIKANIFIYAFILFLVGLNLYALFGIIYPVYR
jgi:4-amino-4-deoxy-L-arabinose transferase-like glycosyltransferase